MENGSYQKANSLRIPGHIVCLCFPPYSPELTPIERLWQDVKDQVAWVLVAALDELEHRVETIIAQYSRAAIQSLTSYPYVVHAVHAIGS
jgi:hypothetical protein